MDTDERPEKGVGEIRFETQDLSAFNLMPSGVNPLDAELPLPASPFLSQTTSQITRSPSETCCLDLR